MKGFMKTVGLLLCICMLASLGMVATAEDVTFSSDWVDGTNIVEITPESEGYAPPNGFNGNYMKIVSTSAFYTPHAGVAEAGTDYTFSFRYKATGAIRGFRLYLYHVNSEDIGGAPIDIGSYITTTTKGYITLSCAEGNGEWQSFKTTVSVPNYFTKDASELEAKGIYKSGSHVAMRINVRAGSAMEIADIRLSTNKMENNDFEAYDSASLTTAPTGWVWSTNDTSAPKTVVVENNNAFVKMTPTGPNVNRAPYVKQTINNLQPSTQYRLSFDFRTNSEKNGYARPSLAFISKYIPVGSSTEKKTSVEYSKDNFRYAPTFSDFGDRSVTSNKTGTKSYYNVPGTNLSEATAGVWTDYTVFFTTPASEGKISLELYLMGNGGGLVNGSYADYCYDNVLLEEDYMDFKIFDTNGNPLQALTAGADAVVKVHYVPENLSTAVKNVFLAGYTKSGSVKTLKDLKVVAQTPISAVAFAETPDAGEPNPSCFMPLDYTLNITVPAKADGETVSVALFCMDDLSKLTTATARIDIPVQ